MDQRGQLRDEETQLLVELLPVRDDAQVHAFRAARQTPLHGASGIHVLTTEGIVLMLLRQATIERLANLLPIADIENLAARTAMDWDEVARWAAKMGYGEAYLRVSAPGRPPLPEESSPG